jgi:nicotinamidase-related amidase
VKRTSRSSYEVALISSFVPTIAALRSQARAQGFPVVYTREQHRADLSDFGIELTFEPPHCLEGSGGDEVVAELEPRPEDLIITRKRRYDAFLGTDLDHTLRLRGIENLIVTGVCTDVCVLSTVTTARNLDYRCFVVADAVDGTRPELHEAALAVMGSVFAYVGTASDISALFGMDLVAS